MSRIPGNSTHRPARPARSTALTAAALALSLGVGALGSLAGTSPAGADVTIPGPIGNPLPTPPPIPPLPPANQLTTRYFQRTGGGHVDPFEMDGLNSIFSKWHLNGVGSISFPKVLSVGQTAAYQVCFEGYTVDRDIGSFHQQIDQSSLVVPDIKAEFGQTTNGNGYFAPLPGTDEFGLKPNVSKSVYLHACRTMAFTATKAGSFTLSYGAGSTLSVLIGECPLGCGSVGPNQHKWSTATTDATWQQASLPVQVFGAVDDQVSVPVGGGMRVPVLANDVLPPGGSVQLTATDGAHGSCIPIGDTVLYSNHEPATSDACAYTFRDSVTGATSTATIHVTLASAPTGPTGPPVPPTPGKPSAPSAPTGVTATAGNGKAIVTWTAPASNGSPITGYRITPIQGLFAHDPITVGPGTTSRTITGLWNGCGYQFKVEAINKLGTSPASDLTAQVVPHS